MDFADLISTRISKYRILWFLYHICISSQLEISQMNQSQPKDFNQNLQEITSELYILPTQATKCTGLQMDRLNRGKNASFFVVAATNHWSEKNNSPIKTIPFFPTDEELINCCLQFNYQKLSIYVTFSFKQATLKLDHHFTSFNLQQYSRLKTAVIQKLLHEPYFLILWGINLHQCSRH